MDGQPRAAHRSRPDLHRRGVAGGGQLAEHPSAALDHCQPLSGDWQAARSSGITPRGNKGRGQLAAEGDRAEGLPPKARTRRSSSGRSTPREHGGRCQQATVRNWRGGRSSRTAGTATTILPIVGVNRGTGPTPRRAVPPRLHGPYPGFQVTNPTGGGSPGGRPHGSRKSVSHGAGVASEAADDVVLALNQAATKAILYGSTGGQPVQVAAHVNDVIQASVLDHGPDLPAQPNRCRHGRAGRSQPVAAAPADG